MIIHVGFSLDLPDDVVARLTPKVRSEEERADAIAERLKEEDLTDYLDYMTGGEPDIEVLG